MYVYFYLASFQKEQEIAEVQCRVGVRAEFECGVLDIYGEGNCNKEGAATLSWKGSPLFVWRAWSMVR